ncbi:hypothetical protein J1N35_026855 [Gossypium stocksii]|uniref:Reverse transcriptase domain-containing protein n=1 Tax=Gossypium stocksii TaxID=47602 RepID=A0A9D3V914_9ROSI|nr:hypothetical protein J1N35_026855 [Gossypium stocksii]
MVPHSPIRFGLNLSHIFFVYNLVIFSKSDLKQAQVLMETLDNFCAFSGHWVNACKTNIFFLSGVDEDLKDKISSTLGFQKVQNLGTYLGVPLFHDKVTSSTLRLVIDKGDESDRQHVITPKPGTCNQVHRSRFSRPLSRFKAAFR